MGEVIFEAEARKGALERFTFVTVAFEGSKQGMLLQARSMRLYLPRDLAQEIIIVNNSSSPSALVVAREECGAAVFAGLRMAFSTRLEPMSTWPSSKKSRKPS